ncbi:MAG: 6-bladed beta-propeller, partial [Pedobacter sp.]
MQRRRFITSTAVIAGSLAIGKKLYANEPADILGHNNRRYTLNKQWSQAVPATNPVKDCHEMVQDKNGRILLLTNETRNNVIVYDRKGKLLTSWGHEYPGAHGLTLFNENGPDVLYIADNS